MSAMVRWIIKGAIYVLVVWPLVGAISGAIFGSGGWGAFIGFVAAVSLAVWLERTGRSNRILARVFGGTVAAAPSAEVSMSALFGVNPNAVVTTVICSQCGATVTLYDGHGKCEACDSQF